MYTNNNMANSLSSLFINLKDKRYENKTSCSCTNGRRTTMDKRSRILAYWMSNMDVPMKDIAEILGCDYVTVSRTIAKYLKIFKELKNK